MPGLLRGAAAGHGPWRDWKRLGPLLGELEAGWVGWAVRADELGRELSPEEDGQAEGRFAGAERRGGGRVGDPAGWPVVREERQGTRGQLGPVHKGLSADFWPCAVGILSVGFCFFPAVESEKGSEDERCVEGPAAGASGERGCFVLWTSSPCSLLSDTVCLPSFHVPQLVCHGTAGCTDEVWSR